MAKIAHGAAAAAFGIENFHPFLPPLILDRNHEANAPYYVGGVLELETRTRGLRHNIEFRAVNFEGQRYLVVRLRLFSNAGFPTYHVVVGTIEGTPSFINQLSVPEGPSDA